MSFGKELGKAMLLFGLNVGTRMAGAALDGTPETRPKTVLIDAAMEFAHNEGGPLNKVLDKMFDEADTRAVFGKYEPVADILMNKLATYAVAARADRAEGVQPKDAVVLDEKAVLKELESLLPKVDKKAK